MLSNKFAVGDFMYITICGSVFIGLFIGFCRSALAHRKELKHEKIQREKDRIYNIELEKHWDSYFSCKTGVIKKEKDVI